MNALQVSVVSWCIASSIACPACMGTSAVMSRASFVDYGNV